MRTVQEETSLLSTCVDYTPKDLRDIADKMENEGFISIELTLEERPYYEGQYLMVYLNRPETKEEEAKRLQYAESERLKSIVWKRQELARLKKELGEE